MSRIKKIIYVIESPVSGTIVAIIVVKRGINCPLRSVAAIFGTKESHWRLPPGQATMSLVAKSRTLGSLNAISVTRCNSQLIWLH